MTKVIFIDKCGECPHYYVDFGDHPQRNAEGVAYWSYCLAMDQPYPETFHDSMPEWCPLDNSVRISYEAVCTKPRKNGTIGEIEQEKV